MNISETVTGLQHIGIPTNDIEKTIAFYNSLGFQTIYRTVNKAANPPEPVAFMAVSYTHLRAHETRRQLVCRLQLE